MCPAICLTVFVVVRWASDNRLGECQPCSQSVGREFPTSSMSLMVPTFRMAVWGLHRCVVIFLIVLMVGQWVVLMQGTLWFSWSARGFLTSSRHFRARELEQWNRMPRYAGKTEHDRGRLHIRHLLRRCRIPPLCLEVHLDEASALPAGRSTLQGWTGLYSHCVRKPYFSFMYHIYTDAWPYLDYS